AAWRGRQRVSARCARRSRPASFTCEIALKSSFSPAWAAVSFARRGPSLFWDGGVGPSTKKVKSLFKLNKNQNTTEVRQFVRTIVPSPRERRASEASGPGTGTGQPAPPQGRRQRRERLAVRVAAAAAVLMAGLAVSVALVVHGLGPDGWSALRRDLSRWTARAVSTAGIDAGLVMSGAPRLELDGAASAQARGAADGEAFVIVRDSVFRPGVLRVPVDTTVVWQFEGRLGHTVTADDGRFDSGILPRGSQFRITFNEPGRYQYYCIPHGQPGGHCMAGVI